MFIRNTVFTLAVAISFTIQIAVFATDSKQDAAEEVMFHDAHYHPSNYIQKGISSADLLEIVEERIGRVAVMGIPLQQKWDHLISSNRAPNYYLRSAASLYYYSFVDAVIAKDYLSLSAEQKERFDPMITGFNPTDMYASDHIRRVLTTFPGVFVGIGEFSVHKEFVSSKVTGHAASLLNPALDSIFETAAEIGLVAVIHCDINNVRPGEPPDHYMDLLNLVKRHPQTAIIWAHTGLGRFVKPSADHVSLIEAVVETADSNHVAFDISWDLVNEYMVQDKNSIMAWARLINKYPSRFLFGSDAVAPKNWEAYVKPYMILDKLWSQLSPEAMRLVTTGNYERIFDMARLRVREWEAGVLHQRR